MAYLFTQAFCWREASGPRPICHWRAPPAAAGSELFINCCLFTPRAAAGAPSVKPAWVAAMGMPAGHEARRYPGVPAGMLATLNQTPPSTQKRDRPNYPIPRTTKPEASPAQSCKTRRLQQNRRRRLQQHRFRPEKPKPRQIPLAKQTRSCCSGAPSPCTSAEGGQVPADSCAQHSVNIWPGGMPAGTAAHAVAPARRACSRSAPARWELSILLISLCQFISWQRARNESP